MKESSCEMKGFLSLLILWMLNKHSLTGAEIAMQIAHRRGSKPSPGTIYPALKDLKEKGLISANKKKEYSLTKKGREELHHGLQMFCTVFSDFQQMRSCCGR
jgi:DNA-binding PadR family transcriptional regulator